MIPLPAAIAGSSQREARLRRAMLHMLEDLKRERDLMLHARRQWVQTVDSMIDPLMVHDSEGRIVRANRAYAERAGMDFVEMLGRPYWRCFPKRDGPLPGWPAGEYEFQLDGGEIFVSHASTYPDGQALHIFRNITERRRLQAALEGSERHHRKLIEGSADAFFILDRTAQIMYRSPSGKRLTGYDDADVLGNGVAAFVLPEDLPVFRKTFADVLREPAAVAHAEVRVLRKDGSQIYVDAVAKNFLDDPDVRGIVVTVRDITERKRAEELQRARSLRLSVQAAALAEAVASPSLGAGEVEGFAREITELAARTAGCERANAWLFTEDESELRCIDLYEATPAKHSAGFVLKEAEFRSEFEALRRSAYVNADNPLTDPRTAGYAEGYLKPLNITSMLDVVVAFGGRHLGLLCLEHVGRAHHWEDDEIAFACQLADKIALAIVNRERLAALRKLGALMEHASDLVVVIDAQGIVQYVSPSIRRMGGYEAEELLARSFTVLMHPEDARVAAGNLVGLASAPGSTHEAEFRYRAKDGRWLTLASVAKNALDDPAVRGIVLNVRDITERKRAEEALRASRDLLESVVEHAPIRVFWKDRDLRFLGCNALFARDAGRERPQDLIGEDDFQMAWRDHAELYRADDRQVMDSGVPKIGFEEPQTSPDGRSIWLRTSKVPLHDAGGKVIGVLGIYEDITERKRVEATMAQQIEELQSWQSVNLGREDRVLELKREVNDLLGRLREPPRYASAEEEPKPLKGTEN